MAGPLLNILANRGHTQQRIACMHAREHPKLTTISQVRRHRKENACLANIPIINLCDHINSDKFIHNIATCVALASAHPVDVQTSIVTSIRCSYLIFMQLLHPQCMQFTFNGNDE